MTKLSEYLESGRCQCIVADYDDTLFGWCDVLDDDALLVEAEMTYDFLTGENWYANHENVCIPIDFMQEFLAVMRPKVQHAYCLSWSDWSAPYKYKIKQVTKHYPKIFDEVMFAGTREAKVEVLNRISSTFGLKHNQVLLIDDHPLTNNEARKEGYATTSPIGVYMYMKALREKSAPKSPSGYEQMHMTFEGQNYDHDITVY